MPTTNLQVRSAILKNDFIGLVHLLYDADLKRLGFGQQRDRVRIKVNIKPWTGALLEDPPAAYRPS